MFMDSLTTVVSDYRLVLARVWYFTTKYRIMVFEVKFLISGKQ